MLRWWLLVALFSNARGKAARPGAPCAHALMIVAHPDDETLFAGEALLGRTASLPGNCRNVAWQVVSVTGGDWRDRREDIRRALSVARKHGLSYEIQEQVWDFEDCNLEYCMKFANRANGLPIAEGEGVKDRLARLIYKGSWDFVITHNEHGEYHHLLHIALHLIVKQLLANTPPNIKVPRFLVFNPLPELNVSASIGKMRMLHAYFLGRNVKKPRFLLFGLLSKYCEHIVPNEDFARPKVLGLSYSSASMDHEGLYFQYLWAVMPHKDWGPLTVYNSKKAYPLVEELMMHNYHNACGKKNKLSHPRYPGICANLGRFFSVKDARLRHLLEEMEVPVVDFPHFSRPPQGIQQEVAGNVPLDCVALCSRSAGSSCPAECSARPEGQPHWRCLFQHQIPSSSRVGGWLLRGEAPGPLWLELWVARPISVGWRQGKAAYRIVAGSGPHLVSLSPRSFVDIPQEAEFTVRPHDVAGWSLWSGAASDLQPVDKTGPPDEAVCMGHKDVCNEAGLCLFPTRRTFIPVTEVQLKLRPLQLTRHPTMPYQVRPSLDISEYIDHSTSYEELLTIRQRLEHPDLAIFEDKIRLRRELLPAAGVDATPSIHLSNTDTDLTKHLQGRLAYVVKPSHMSESQNVFVVANGVNLLRQAWGFPEPTASIEEIQAAVNTFMNKTALQWECKALLSVPPGVIVEELVLAQDTTGKLRVDEYKFFTVWGRVILSENVPFSSGAVMEIDRNGSILTSKASCPPFCVSPCYHRMVEIAEKVAVFAQTDFLRVDLLVEGKCDALYVSEVELFPASDFSPDLKVEVARHWVKGYGYKTALEVPWRPQWADMSSS